MAFTQRIVTWNVLSSALSAPSTFVKSDPRYLNPEYRLTLVMPFPLPTNIIGSLKMTLAQVLEQCRRYCDEHAVICLQEVSELWKPKLDELFRAHDYHYEASLYGRPENGEKHATYAARHLQFMTSTQVVWACTRHGRRL